MKRNRFRLETVLRVRRIQEEIVLAEMLTARAEMERSTVHEHQQRMRYLGIVHDSPTEIDVGGFLAEQGRMNRFLHSVLESQTTVALSTDVLNQRRETWSAAAQRVSALQRLHDRHQQSHRVDELAEEVRETDERTTQRRLLFAIPPSVLGESS